MKRLILVVAAVIAMTGCSHVRMGLFLLEDNPSANDPDSVSRGKQAFGANCASCHGMNADGAGTDAKALKSSPTDFRSPTYTKSAALIAAHITYGKGDVMPAFDGTLSEVEIWDTANYLRSLQKPGAE
jgi:mono/diheme cytochrome c family protein